MKACDKESICVYKFMYFLDENNFSHNVYDCNYNLNSLLNSGALTQK